MNFLCYPPIYFSPVTACNTSACLQWRQRRMPRKIDCKQRLVTADMGDIVENRFTLTGCSSRT